METEANYERLRIGGLVFACLLIAGGIGIIVCNCANEKLGNTLSLEIIRYTFW
uniref:FXYD domain-containing ion transport regulator n=1 Tax=Periophthalmus magnuspinnatus TaxID=409849 RepID=A0A3B4AWA6_9GOBI